MHRFVFSLALPLVAVACAPSTDGDAVADEANLTTARACAAGSVSTQLHADFPDGTSLDQDDCFGTKAISGLDGAEGDFWNYQYLDFRLTSPDGATQVSFHSVIHGAGTLQPGDELRLPSTDGTNDWMRLSLVTAHGSPEGGPGTLRFDDWKFPSMDKADGLLSATITTTLKAVDGSETKVRLKVAGIVLDNFLI
jgi:hypothetical protein